MTKILMIILLLLSVLTLILFFYLLKIYDKLVTCRLMNKNWKFNRELAIKIINENVGDMLDPFLAAQLEGLIKSTNMSNLIDFVQNN